VPARYNAFGTLESHRSYTAILRVNQQIHDEGIDLLYRKTAFGVGVSDVGIVMLNTNHWTPNIPAPHNLSHCTSTGSPALEDYQMQLMLLEQQNKRRLLLARQMQANTGLQGVNPPPTRSTRRFEASTFTPQDSFASEHGPIWKPSLSDSYFNLIRSFKVEIELQIPSSQQAGSHQRQQMMTVPGQVFTNLNEHLEKNMYEVCDRIHQVVGRLELAKSSILNLEITVTINAFHERGEALAALQLLLRPFKRLRNVVHPKVIGVHWRPSSSPIDAWAELLTPIIGGREDDTSIGGFLRRWQAELSSSGPVPAAPKAVRAYWVLHAMLLDISLHKCRGHPNTIFESYFDRGRIAREAGDIVGLQEVWDNVMEDWTKQVAAQKALEDRISCSVALMDEMMCDGQQPLLPSGFGEQMCNGKGKAKVEDDGSATTSWVDLDGTRYSWRDGQVRVQLLTPAVVSYVCHIQNSKEYHRIVANI